MSRTFMQNCPLGCPLLGGKQVYETAVVILHCDTVQNTNSCNSHLKQSWSIYFRSILEELLTAIKKILQKLCLTRNFLLTSEQPTYCTHLYKIQYQLQLIITNSSTLLYNIELFYLYNRHFIQYRRTSHYQMWIWLFFCIVTAATFTKKKYYVVKL